MTVATIARKPLRGTVADNVLKHGVGGIAVDACRIAGSQGSGTWGTSNATVSESRMFNNSPGMKDFRTVPHAGGRWPANVAIVHAAGCVLKGCRTGDDALGEVEEWECVAGCPVVEMDRQSGISASPKAYLRNAPGKDKLYSGNIGQKAGDVCPSFGDEGGASRFFKKVGREP